MSSGTVIITPGYRFNEVADEAVTRAKLNKLIDELTARLAAGAVTSRELADGSITADKLAATLAAQLGLEDGSVTTAKLVDGAVTEPKIADGAVTPAKLAITDLFGLIAPMALTSANFSALGAPAQAHVSWPTDWTNALDDDSATFVTIQPAKEISGSGETWSTTVIDLGSVKRGTVEMVIGLVRTAATYSKFVLGCGYSKATHQTSGEGLSAVGLASAENDNQTGAMELIVGLIAPFWGRYLLLHTLQNTAGGASLKVYTVKVRA